MARNISDIKNRIAAFTKKAQQLGDQSADNTQNVTDAAAGKPQPEVASSTDHRPANNSNKDQTGDNVLPPAAGLNAKSDGSNAPSAPTQPMITTGSDSSKSATADELAKKASGAASRLQAFLAPKVAAAPTPAATPAAAPAKSATDANAEQIELSRDFLCKLASALLSTEDGRADVERTLQKLQGVDAARQLVKDAAASIDAVLTDDENYALMQKQAYDQHMAEAYQLQEYLAGCAPEERARVVKLASALEVAASKMETPLERHCLALGAQDGQHYLESITTKKIASIPGAAMPPEGGAPPEAGAEGGAGGGEVTPEMVAQVIQQLVEQGEIQPEEAQQIMAEFAKGQGGGGEGGAGGGAMPPDGAAGAPPEMQEAQESAQKMASLVDAAV